MRTGRCLARFYALLALLPLTLPLCSASAETIAILPLGDSITQAEINRASYRYPLWKKLIEAGIEFDFVGSMDTQQDLYSKGKPPQPDYLGHKFDPDHEGHFGWTAGQIVAGRNPKNGTGSGNLRGWLSGYDFDIAMVHLGTNDVFYKRSNQQIAQALRNIIASLRNDNPEAIILLAQVIPAARDDRTSKALLSMNRMIASLSEELSTVRSPVRVVDQYTGFDSRADSYDGIHPNASGEEKMANRWFEAISHSLR